VTGGFGRGKVVETRHAALALLRSRTQPVGTINELHQVTGEEEVVQAQ